MCVQVGARWDRVAASDRPPAVANVHSHGRQKNAADNAGVFSYQRTRLIEESDLL